jgi:hypothetical protein
MGDNYFNDANNSYDSNKLYNKWKSMEQSYDAMPQDIWNAKSEYYMSMGSVGLEKLEKLKRKEIAKDYRMKKKQYTDEINRKYDEYYDKLETLYNLKDMNGKQIELINNTQHKILEQRDVRKEVVDDISTKNRLMTYNTHIAMKRRTEIQRNVYLMLMLLFLLVVIFGMNAGKLSNPRAMYTIFSESNQLLSGLFLVTILFVLIVFKAYNLIILLLIVYAFLTILSA